MPEFHQEAIETRSSIPPFFHMWTNVDSKGAVSISTDALAALDEYIKLFVDELKKKDEALTSWLKAKNLTVQVVTQAVEKLEAIQKPNKADRVRKLFARLVKWRLKKKDKKELFTEVEKRREPQFSYVLPIEYLNSDLDRVVFKIDFVLWADSSANSIYESLKWKGRNMNATNTH